MNDFMENLGEFEGLELAMQELEVMDAPGWVTAIISGAISLSVGVTIT